jgi:endonuclease/exonuclease/phosphatase (EEP) superfamily protein YafD
VPWGVNQVTELPRMTGLQYYHWGRTAQLGAAGFKAVAILSRHQLVDPRVHPVMRGSVPTTYATLEGTVLVSNVAHRIFSTRFDAYNLTDNIAGHQQAIDRLNRLDRGIPVIFGGDFNTKMTAPQFTNFVQNSGLVNAWDILPDPNACVSPEGPIDHISYRGRPFVTFSDRVTSS